MEPQKCEVFALQGEIVLHGEAVLNAIFDSFNASCEKLLWPNLKRGETEIDAILVRRRQSFFRQSGYHFS